MRRNKLWTIGAAVPLLVSGLWVMPSSAVESAGSVNLAAGQAPLSASQAQALSKNVNQRVIIVMKNQLGTTPDTAHLATARRHAESVLQSPVLSELSATKARRVHSYTVLNAITATVSSGERARLAANPNVAEVVPDQIIHLAPVPAASGIGAHTSTGNSPVPGTCSSNPNKPALEPQAISDIHADSANPSAKTARSLGITGAGVKVAFIADGIEVLDTAW